MAPQPKNLDHAYARLQEISALFEQGEINLEQSIPLTKEALVLGKYIKSRLSEMDNQIEEITKEFDELITDSKQLEIDDEPQF